MHRWAGARFNTSPIVFTEKDKSYVAATGADGRLYLLAADALGGADHKTPIASTMVSAAKGDLSSMATTHPSLTRHSSQ